MSEPLLPRHRISSGALLLLSLAWLALTLWLRPLALPDEGRYVGVAWEMVRSGQWLTPTLDGLPYFHKPPLSYWITASALSVFGNQEWAARLAPFAGAAAGALALWRFAQRWCGDAGARLMLLALATQPLFYVGAQFANLDMLVAGCIAVTILAAADAVLRSQRGEPNRGPLALAFLFAALGLLAKGLIGAVLPALVIVAWLAAQRRPRLLLPLLWLPGFALFVAVAAPWFLAMQSRFPQFADYFFIVQHFKRFAEGGFNNAQPFYFFPAVLALVTLPWFAWLPQAMRSRYWRDPKHGPIRQLMWIWVGVVTLFFSMPQSKLVGYILPVTFPLAWLIGEGAAPLLAASPRARRLWQASAALAAAICLGTVIVATVTADKSLRGLGRALARAATPQDSLVFVKDYYFDLPFYARWPAPVLVVDDWGDPKLTRSDNWRKELYDARQFSPAAAPPVLIEPDLLPRAICGKGVTWVVLHADNLGRYPELARGSEVARQGGTLLWRVPGAVSPADCPGTPSANSPDKS